MANTKSKTTKKANPKKAENSKKVEEKIKKETLSKVENTSKKETKVPAATPKKLVEDKKVEIKSDNSITGKKQESNTLLDTLTKPDNLNKILAVLISLILISSFWVFNLYWIPEKILTLRDSEVAKKNAEKEEKDRAEKQEALKKQLAVEDQTLKFETNTKWEIGIQIVNYGELNFNMDKEFAPKSVENFVRLTNRGYFNNTTFHRIVKDVNFAVIQGGDADNKNGTGGKSAFYINDQDKGYVPDEIWLTKPEYKQEGGANVLTNQPKLRNETLYSDFKTDDGTIKYKKGLILMAKTQEPDTATSQFFITVRDTILPAEYTAFGVVKAEDMEILDKIFDKMEVEQVPSSDGQEAKAQTSGKPKEGLKLEKAVIISPKL